MAGVPRLNWGLLREANHMKLLGYRDLNPRQCHHTALSSCQSLRPAANQTLKPLLTFEELMVIANAEGEVERPWCYPWNPMQ